MDNFYFQFMKNISLMHRTHVLTKYTLFIAHRDCTSITFVAKDLLRLHNAILYMSAWTHLLIWCDFLLGKLEQFLCKSILCIVQLSNSLRTYHFNAQHNAMIAWYQYCCHCVSIHLSICHKLVFYQNDWSNRAYFWHRGLLPLKPHFIIRKFGYLQK